MTTYLGEEHTGLIGAHLIRAWIMKVSKTVNDDLSITTFVKLQFLVLELSLLK